MKILTFILLFSFSLSSFSQIKDDSLTIVKSISRFRIPAVCISPDEKRVAFVVTEPIKGNLPPNSDIWIYEVQSKELYQFTRSPKSDYYPQWSPDSKSLAFLSARDSITQIYLLKLRGGEAFPVTKSKTSVEAFEWSPDGKTIAYLAKEPASSDEEKKIKDQEDETIANTEKPTRLWLVDILSLKAVQKSLQNWKISEIKWLPNGRSLALMVQPLPETEEGISELKFFNLEGESFTSLQVPKHPFWGEIRFSPDSKSMGFISARENGPIPHDLFLQSLDQGASRNATAQRLDLPVNDYRFLPNGNIIFSAQNGFHTGLFTLKPNGTIAPFPLNQNVGLFDISPSGAIAYTGLSSIRPEELWVKLQDSVSFQVTSFNKNFEKYHLIEPEYIHYKSFDGLVIEGSFYKPANVKGAVPLIVIIHGGPTAAWTDSYMPWRQLFLDKGYAVFCPNIRGSTGYGWEFLTKNKNDWGGSDFKDLMAGIDFLVSRGDVDTNHLGITGWSYGGYMTMWAVTQTNRFKAAIAGAGLSDLASEYGTEDNSAYDRWFFGTPYENLKNFTKSSPITFVKNVKTPTLIIQGEADPTDPAGQSQQFYRGLRHYGVACELVIYPREQHSFAEEKHILDYVKRMLSWFDRYLR